MTEASRRSFLSGMLSLLAVSTSPIPLRAGNFPALWGDGEHDDAAGLRALLQKEPCLIYADGVLVDDHRGIIMHWGEFVLEQTLEVPEEVNILIERARFNLMRLADDAPAFRLSEGKQVSVFANRRGCDFGHKPGRRAFIEYKKEHWLKGFEEREKMPAANTRYGIATDTYVEI